MRGELIQLGASFHGRGRTRPIVDVFAIFLLLLPMVSSAQNIIVVIGDDMGVDTLGLYGEQPFVAPTPTLDALAGQGVFFRNAWAYPTCSPFRVSVLTGRHPYQHGVGFGINSSEGRSYVLDPWLPNLANLLAGSGYRTAALGKFHMSNELGFKALDFFDGVLSATESAPNDLGFAYHAGHLFGGLNYFSWPKTKNGVTAYTTTYATTDTTDEALAQLQGSEPFFLWVAYNAPHGPVHEPPHELLADPSVYDFSEGRELFRAMIESLDTELGRIMAAVDLSDTTVIFVGDNGSPRGLIEPPLLDLHAKRTVYEGGLNVPLIVAGQAVSPSARGGESRALVQAIDLFATVLEIAAVEGPERDSVSALPYLTDPATPSQRTTVFSESYIPNGGPPDPLEHKRAAREARYKLIRNGLDPDELYDLETDPHEQSPLDLTSLSAGEAAAYLKLQQELAAQQPTPMVPALGPGPRGILTALVALAAFASLRGRCREYSRYARSAAACARRGTA